MTITLYHINSLSHELTENLKNVKESIYLSEIIPFEDKWELIEKINSFHGLEACGFFTLGRQHLTSIVGNFTTFIIVLIQFKMTEI